MDAILFDNGVFRVEVDRDGDVTYSFNDGEYYFKIERLCELADFLANQNLCRFSFQPCFSHTYEKEP